MRALLLPVARIAVAYPNATRAIGIMAIMVAGGFAFRSIIAGYGHIGFVAIMAALFAFGFWLERRTSDQG